MSAVKNDPQLWSDLLEVLEEAPDRRLAVCTLETRIRAKGWRGWRTPHGWVPMLVEMGFHIYPGRNARNNRVRWVSAEPPPKIELDEFERQGYILVRMEEPLRFCSRASVPGAVKFGSERRLAKVWRDYGWAARYARNNNLVWCTEVASTRHLR